MTYRWGTEIQQTSGYGSEKYYSLRIAMVVIIRAILLPMLEVITPDQWRTSRAADFSVFPYEFTDHVCEYGAKSNLLAKHVALCSTVLTTN